MLIASFNANGIRPRLPIILKWLEETEPDVLCLQETKVQDPDFPHRPLAAAGYHVTFKGQKSYNGVAVLTKTPPQQVRIGLQDDDIDQEARLVMVKVQGVAIVNTYVPQGQDPASDKFRYKLDWLARLGQFFQTHFTPQDALVWTGDFNVAPSALDVYDPEALYGRVCYHPDEHAALEHLRNWGLVDVYRQQQPDRKAYTFWDYRIPNALKRGLGWRIDHIWATRPLAAKATAAWIDDRPRQAARPSDHTFIAATFAL